MINIAKPISPNNYIFHDTYIEIKIHSPTFGDFDVLIDKDDYEKVKQYHWCINKCWNKNIQSAYGYIWSYEQNFIKPQMD